MFRENKVLAKISEITIYPSDLILHCLLKGLLNISADDKIRLLLL